MIAITMRITVLFIITILALEATAQTGTIRGRVFDEDSNEGLPFVNLVIEGTNIGSTTDLDGNFTFTGITPGFVRLRVSAVGYETRLSSEFQVNPNRTPMST